MLTGGHITGIVIVAIVMIAMVLKAKYRREGTVNDDPAARQDSLRLREEVKELKERIKVLERITVEKENSLAAQIEELRDR